jgi:hypothetical protein
VLFKFLFPKCKRLHSHLRLHRHFCPYENTTATALKPKIRFHPLTLASTILAAPTTNDLTSLDNLTARDSRPRVYYYDDSACTKWTTYVDPKLGLSACYKYQWNRMKSANIVTCNSSIGCVCTFYSDDDCSRQVYHISVDRNLSRQSGSHNCANAQGVGIRSMVCAAF